MDIQKQLSGVDAAEKSHFPQDSGSEPEEPSWTSDEETRVVRKLDRLVMPLLMLSFFALQLDRGNIGNALTDYFFRDVGITQNQFNIGQQLLSLGIVLLEIPSNFVLYRVGPAKWIGAQIIAWGLVATFQAFQKGVAAFMVTRLLLGLTESGFIPAGLYTITRFYKRDETSKRFSWFFIGNMSAQAVSGLLAYAILHMRGIGGLGGWQWLFLLEGIFTVLVGCTFIALFPLSPVHPVPWMASISYFDEREKRILLQRVLIDDPSKRHAGHDISKAEFKSLFTNWRLIPHIFLTISGLAPTAVMWNYAPTLIRGYGYGRLRSNAMVSIGQWCSLILTVTWGFLADKWGRRGPLVSLGVLMWWACVVASRTLIYSHNPKSRFAALTLGIAVSGFWHPVNGSWLALNARSAGERSITMAVFIMSANCSGIVGSQLFQQQDAPYYPVGWTVIVALVSFSLVNTIVANLQYWLLNRRNRRAGIDQAKEYSL